MTAKPFVTLLAIALLMFPANSQAQEADLEVNDVLQTFSADLDGDGKADSIELHVVEVDEYGHTDQLVVRKSDGTKLWEGPIFKFGYDDYEPELAVFGAWPYGISDIALVTDFAHPGQVVLFSPVPQSDVRPTTWRMFLWNGKGFTFADLGRLIESKKGSDEFIWSEAEADAKVWVNDFELVGKDVIAEIAVYKSDSELLIGKAKMLMTDQGLKIGTWIEKPALPH